MDLEKFRIGLVFRNNDIIVLGEYKDDGTMDEDSMGVISDFDSIYEDLPLNKFGVVEIQRSEKNGEDQIELKDYHTYAIGENAGIESVMEIYREDSEDFFDIINDLYESILNEIAH
jgi:hypothetical protein